MAYTAKCDTAVATKWWITGTGSTVNRLSEVMDDNPAGVEEDDNPGNFQPWTTFMTEHVEDRIYQIHLPLEIGNGSTSTTLISLNEHVYFDDNTGFIIKALATLTIGAKVGDWGTNGSYWNVSWADNANVTFVNAATTTLQIYASHLHCRSLTQLYAISGTVEILNSILSMLEKDNPSWRHTYNFGNLVSGIFKRVFNTNVYAAKFQAAQDTMEDIHVHNCASGMWGQSSGVEASDVLITSNSGNQLYNQGEGSTLKIIDPKISTTSRANYLTLETDWCAEAYTINIHITDKDGANLSGATVNLEGSDSSNYDTDAWTADSVTTAADGTITEQTVTAKKWVGTSETETDYNVFRLTISKSGYETLVLENITIDSPIDWHLELLPALSEGDVRAGVSFGENKTGTMPPPKVYVVG